MTMVAEQTFLNLRAEWWSVIGVWFTGVITVALALFAWRQISQNRQQRDDQTRPFVIVDFHFRNLLVSLSVSNIGRTAATDVRVQLDEEIVSAAELASWQRSGPFGEGVSLFAPGREMRFPMDMYSDRATAKLPMRFSGTVRYRRARREGEEICEDFVLDLSAYAESLLAPKDLHDLVTELESFRKSTEKWTDGSKGILVNAVDRRADGIRVARPTHLREAARHREEGGWRAYAAYFLKLWQRRHGLKPR